MPRLSLWKPEKGNDYKFFDKTISEMFQVGATDLYIYKYIGTNNPANSTDATQPHYDETVVTNIQDLLFQENRDRKYDKNIYRLRGHYNVQNLDFDLSQFGLFLNNDIIFITVHYNDMIDIIGRKLMVGDVFELPHLTDYHPLDETIPIGLRRYYQITDANFASEGFSQTWFPHLWRIKCEPLVNTQEFKDILNQPINKDNYLGDYDPKKEYPEGYTVTYGDKIYTPKKPGPVPPGVYPPDPDWWEEVPDSTYGDLVSTYKKNIDINDKIIEEAKRLVPMIGYDRRQLYVVPTFTDGEPSLPSDVVIDEGVPAFPTGPVIIIGSTGVLRIPAANPMNIGSKFSVMLQEHVIGPVLTEQGSGPVVGDPCICCDIIGPDIGFFGTADSTEARSDQYVTEILTAVRVAPKTKTFSVVSIPESFSVQVLVQATVKNNKIFPTNTRVVSFDRVAKTITVDKATIYSMPAGTPVVVNGDFDGIVTPNMDYRADSNPSFRFIRRDTPRSFGWVAGYNTGDGSAPNGEPVGSGTTFPANPRLGDYFLRIDYTPQKLYRYNGAVWVEISRNVRTATGFGVDDESQLSTFINNTATVMTSNGTTIPSRQGLSNALRITPD